MPIVVVGMHRSGTSLVAHALHEMGVCMGRDFLEPDDANPGGYWEDVDFLDLDKRILAACGGDWRSIVKRKEIMAIADKFSDEIEALVQERQAKGVPWGWKDPRTAMTMELYHPHIKAPRYVVVRRGGVAILDSLQRVHGDGGWKGLAKHYRAHIRAFLSVRKPVFLEVHYEDLVDERLAPGVVAVLARFANISMDKVDRGLAVIEYKNDRISAETT